MKHGAIHIIVGALALCLMANGCRAKKNISRNEEVQKRIERVEQSSDSARIEARKAEKAVQQTEQSDLSYTRVTEYDSTGSIVRRVSETWRDGRLSHFSLQDNRAETISVTGNEKEVVERDTSLRVNTEVIATTTDTRPVQGFEWAWIIIGAFVVIGLIVFLWRKFK